jgi:ABC-type transport system substrate-binding protein
MKNFIRKAALGFGVLVFAVAAFAQSGINVFQQYGDWWVSNNSGQTLNITFVTTSDAAGLITLTPGRESTTTDSTDHPYRFWACVAPHMAYSPSGINYNSSDVTCSGRW